VNHKAFFKACRKAGGVVDKSGGKGSHVKVRFPSGALTVPTHGKSAKDVPFYVLKQARALGVSC
jgi:predicted RNA binding protein YcfA (HicA-like mRNA interferase family)